MNSGVRSVVLGVVALALNVAPAVACRIPVIEPRWVVPPPQPPPRVDPMLTRMHKAEIAIDGSVARVEVAATFYNPNSFRAEGTYFFPIEPDAVVKDFAMTVNGKEQKAELVDADKARRIYEDIVRRQKDPGLLEYVGTRMLQARVFPIEPRSEVAVRLVYNQVVKADAGLYHFRYPLQSARPNEGKVDQVALRATVNAETPIKLFYSPSHKIDTVRKTDRTAAGGFEQAGVVPDRGFDLYWSLDKADVGVSVAAFQPKDEDGFCMISLSPKVEVDKSAVAPKDIVFVFDKSGSMAGDKIAQARGALRYCLDRLNPDDRFGLLAFSTDVDPLTDGLAKAAPEAVARAKEQVEKIDARGGTAIHDALVAACRMFSATNRLGMVVFLTDGLPTVGPVGVDEILAAVKKSNAASARVFVFGVGTGVNTDLLDRLAGENRGMQDYVGEKEDIEVKVSNFYEKVAQPVLSDVTVEAGGVKLRDLYPREIPDIFRGAQVLLFGRYKGGGRQTVVVRGRAAGRERVFECEADFAGSTRNDFLPPIWAQRKVAFLLEQVRINGHKKELEDEIVSLGKKYGIMTPYTSFLILEDQAPERQMLTETRRRFEGEKSGAGGVYLSGNLARAKGAAMAPAAAAADGTMTMGFAMGGAEGGGGVGADRAEALTRERMKRVADKVFYLKPDGFYYDSAFEEKDRAGIVEVKYMSDEYFALVAQNPAAGKYMAAHLKMVVCLDGKVYRIVE